MSLITLPNIPALTAEFRVVYVIAESESPFSLSQQTYDWGGARWEGEIVIEAASWEENCLMKAFIMQCKGKTNSFLFGDPEYLVRGPRGAVAGTLLVKGASQAGASLIVDGFANSTTGVVKAGDYLQLGTGTSARLYGILADANSDGTGTATISLDRPLRSTPSDNAAVVITGAKGAMKLADNNIGWSANPTGVSKIVIPFKEVI